MHSDIIGINWGSSNFRAYRIAPGGDVIDAIETPSGVATLDRDGMAALVAQVAARWPSVDRIYAAGMIGSNLGWTDAGYAECPVALEQLRAALTDCSIGEVAVRIVPGIACRRAGDGAPDIMRGEETELFGLLASPAGTGLSAQGMAALPGTHTKWVRIADGRIVDFLTCMSGEIFDRLTAAGLLASIVEGEAREGAAFSQAVRLGFSRGLGLGALLFGARARVIRGDLARADAASHLRGLLIGAEIADALALFPAIAEDGIPLIGSSAVCRLYHAALAELGIASRSIDARDAATRGFLALDGASRLRAVA